jgi:hypothetical protein
LEIVTLQQTIPIKWSPLGDLAFSYGNKRVLTRIDEDVNTITSVLEKDSGIQSTDQTKDRSDIFDISVEMRVRAEQGYSMDVSNYRSYYFVSNGRIDCQ